MSRIKKILVSFVTIFALVIIVPAVIPNAPTAIQAEAAKKTIALNRTSLTLEVGEKTNLKLKNATASKVKWSSSNSNKVKVKSGKVAANKIGAVKITAKYKNKTYTCKVKVVEQTAPKIQCTIEPTYYRNGSIYSIKATIKNNSDTSLSVCDDMMIVENVKNVYLLDSTRLISMKNATTAFLGEMDNENDGDTFTTIKSKATKTITYANAEQLYSHTASTYYSFQMYKKNNDIPINYYYYPLNPSKNYFLIYNGTKMVKTVQ